MRSVKVWRDSDRRVYAEDSDTNERYYLPNYAAAITDVTALQDIVSKEIESNTTDFVRWLGGETMPIFHHSVGLTANRS